ncbi:hypothetical protein BCV72DRAFT_200284 [Rhizopus microsporus var. microsporus]|uniref:HCP-like protein n=1 Tax=Rhizopus microsporus var. microsporus TaxID=86635 RepID=A0A1X0RDW3_RHIZD|nr:hypothetical protein BCV72DRAFT_200284 [Rhizopus microsporus var. microsporus]
MHGAGNVPKDYKKAYQCCTQSIAANIPYCQVSSTQQSDIPYSHAQHMIGEMFLHGEGVPKDLAVAKEWFQIASTHGYEPSQIKLQQISILEQNLLQQQREALANGEGTTNQEKRSSRWSLGFFRK